MGAYGLRSVLAAAAGLLALGGPAAACSTPGGPLWCPGDCNAQQTMLVVQNRRCVARTNLQTSFMSSARIAQQPRVGRASIATDGSYTYEPKAGFVGKDQFVVELGIQETRSTKIDKKTVTVTVEVKPPSGNLSGCLRQLGDTPPGADGIIRLRIIPGMSCDLWNNPNVSRSNVTLATQPRQGSVAPSSVRGIVYQANASARGSDRFDVVVESIYTAKPRRVSVEVTFVDVL